MPGSPRQDIGGPQTRLSPNVCIGKKDLAVILTIAVIAFSLISILCFHSEVSLTDRFIPELVRLYGMYDSTVQIKAHLMLLSLTAISCLVGFFYEPMQTIFSRIPVNNDYCKKCLKILHRYCGLLIIPLCIFFVFKKFGPLAGFISVCFSIGITLTLLIVANKSAQFKHLRLFLGVILLFYLALFLMPGLQKTPALGSELQMVEFHYLATVAQADQLAVGKILFRDCVLHYGFTISSIVGYWQRQNGLWSLGGYMEFVKYLQVVFCLLVVYSYCLWKPNKPIYIMLSVMLVIPWVSTIGDAVFYPNQSAFRFLGFPIGLTGLLLLKNIPVVKSALFLGIYSTIVILLNVETGIAITAGYMIFLLLRTDSYTLKKLSMVAGAFTTGATSTLLLMLFLFRCGFGYWPVPSNTIDLFLGGTVSIRGFGGRALYVDGVAIVILCHAVYAVIRTSMVWRMRQLSFCESFRTAIAVVILVWFAYYANRPDPWNLWSFLFLYGFFISSLINLRIPSRTLPPLLRCHFSLPITVWCLIIFPYLLVTNASEAKSSMGRILRDVSANSSLISGVYIPKDIAKTLEQQALFLKSQENSDKLIYFHGDSFLISRLSGIHTTLHVPDAFLFTPTHQDYDALVNKILRLDPDRLFLEATNDESSNSLEIERKKFFERLKCDLALHYRYLESSHGWEIWARRCDSSKSGLNRLCVRK